MKNQAIFVLLFLMISFQGKAVSLYLSDSIGVSEKGGLKYIIHQVETGETLYALSRKYNVDVQLIKDANDASVTRLSVGQKVFIPLAELASGEGKIHTVSASETLYSISRLYSVKVDDLKRWNNLDESSISVGQKLIIENTEDVTDAEVAKTSNMTGETHTVEQSETLYSISRKYNVTTDQLKQWNGLTSNSLSIGQVLVVSNSETIAEAEPVSNTSMLPSAEEQAQEQVAPAPEVTGKAAEVAVAANVIPDIPEERPEDVLDEEVIERATEKVIEKGMAEVIESTSDTKKYLALHRQAPIGTIMQVKNEMNGQSVFVRIVGSIQDTGDNSKVLLMISKKAYDRLGAIDRRFPVQISYMP